MKLPSLYDFDDGLEELEISYSPKIPLSQQEILRLISRVYFQINNAYGSFNDELLFLVCSVFKNSEFCDDKNFKDLIILSLNFVLGFVKFECEEISDITKIFDTDCKKYFNYNYAFLKFLTPLDEKADIYCDFDKKFDITELYSDSKKKITSLIFDCARILIFLREKEFKYTKSELDSVKNKLCCSEFVELFYRIDNYYGLSSKIKKRNYSILIDDYISEINFSESEKFLYLKFLLNIFDFKSTQTFIHIIYAACYAVSLGKNVGCDNSELDELFVGGILHDIGKMAIPRSVLESNGKLSATDFTLMRSHVYFSKKILSGIVPKNIFNIAVHHHEKLDGSGYPDGLTAQNLNLQERILTIVDIFSALAQNRSYKREYTKDEVLKVLGDLAEQNQLDKELFIIINANYESFKQNAEDLKILFNSPIGKVEEFYNTLS